MLRLIWLHKRAPHFVDNHKYYIYFKDFPYLPNQGNNICSFPAFRNQLCMICHSELFVTDWVGSSMLFYLLTGYMSAQKFNKWLDQYFFHDNLEDSTTKSKLSS